MCNPDSKAVTITNLLVIRSNAADTTSAINREINDLLAELATVSDDICVMERDLDGNALTPFTSRAMLPGGGRRRADAEAEQASLELSDELIAELRAADMIIMAAPIGNFGTTSPVKSWFDHVLLGGAFGAPIYSFGIAPALKTWFDHVLRADGTFHYTPQGAEGLLKDKSVIMVGARAGAFSQGPAVDHQLPYIRTLLGYMGITDVSVLIANEEAPAPLRMPLIDNSPRELMACGG